MKLSHASDLRMPDRELSQSSPKSRYRLRLTRIVKIELGSEDEEPDAYPVATLRYSHLDRIEEEAQMLVQVQVRGQANTRANIFLYTALVWDIGTWRHGMHDIETSEVSKESK